MTESSDELMDNKTWDDKERLEQLVMCSNGLDINNVDAKGNTALYNAALNDNVDVVEVVMSHQKIEINKPATDGSTPLYIASRENYETIVKLLLRRSEILVNKGNSEGVSPLQVAARKDHLNITVLLLAHNDIDPNQGDYNDTTPLMEAAIAGHVTVATKILLHPKIEANKATWGGKTALFFACDKQELNVVELLLSCPQTDSTLLDENGKTAKMYSAESNSTEILHTFNSHASLIHRGHSCCSDQVKRGMQIAARNGDLERIAAFLKCKGINVNDGYESDMTPLYIAAVENHTAVAKTLLEFPKIDVNQVANGENALLVAVEFGNVELVTILLEHTDIDTNIVKRGTQGSPLYIASTLPLTESSAQDSGDPQSEIVRQLLQQSQIEVNDVFGTQKRTALIAASASQNWNVVKLLLLCPKVDMNMADSSGKTAIQYATNVTVSFFATREEYLQNEVHTCCVASNDKLLRAAEIGDHKAIRGIAKCPDANINIADFKGRTPLYLASLMNNLKAVEELLAVPQIDPNTGRSSDGKTPFSISSERGYFDVMELLLNHSRINVNEGWVFDSWPSLKEEEIAHWNSTLHYTSRISFKGYIFFTSEKLTLNKDFFLHFHRSKMLQYDKSSRGNHDQRNMGRSRRSATHHAMLAK